MRVRTAAVLLLLAACVLQAQQQFGAPPATQDSLKRFLQMQDDNPTTRYISAFRDLNGDGKPEAIVYLLSSNWCGSGGCTTLVLQSEGSSWKIVTKITLTRPPIWLLKNTSNGWRSIAVWVQGGGIRKGYEAELQFDGKTYPRNPSVPPARRLQRKPAGEVLIPSTKDATPLHSE